MSSLRLSSNIVEVVLHQNQMSILVRSLLPLSLFNPFLQELYFLFVLFFQFGLNALVLHKLNLVHFQFVGSLKRCWTSLWRVIRVEGVASGVHDSFTVLD